MASAIAIMTRELGVPAETLFPDLKQSAATSNLLPMILDERLTMEICQIHKHGIMLCLWGPEREEEDVSGRHQDIESVFRTLAPFVIPLSVEIEFGEADPDTGLFEANGLKRWIVDRAVPETVHVGPSLRHDEEPQFIERIDSSILRAALGNHDILRIRVIASAVRLWENETPYGGVRDGFIAIETKPDAPVIIRDEVGWVAGPINFPGLRLYPPVEVIIDNEQGVLQLNVEVRWSWWSYPGYVGTEAWESFLSRMTEWGFSQEAPEWY